MADKTPRARRPRRGAGGQKQQKSGPRKAAAAKKMRRKGMVRRAATSRGMRILRIARWMAAGIGMVMLLTVLTALVYRWVPPPLTPLMALRYFSPAAAGAGLDYVWKPLREIAPELALAVVAAEDQRFLQHRGFDLVEMQRAMDAAEAGGPLRGASTITQQTVKNVFLWPSRSWLRKGLEAALTPLAELLWGKRRILELYLNIAEFGPGVYGAEAAARRYFGKAAGDLTAHEAASLAAVLPNPIVRSPLDAAGVVPRRRAWILRQMTNLGGTAFLRPVYP